MSTPTNVHEDLPFPPVRQNWLARREEKAIDPQLPIIDAHHHLWYAKDAPYLLEQYVSEIAASGHNVIGSVFVQCFAMYKPDGPEKWRSIGETEFATGVAAASASGLFGPARVCAGIVGHVDLMLGTLAKEVLERHMEIAGSRFCGIRNLSLWDADSSIRGAPMELPRGILGFDRFREGFAQLGPLGLSFDAYLYHHQIGELAALARAFPNTTIILDHVATPLGIGVYAGKRREVFAEWKANVIALSQCPNVRLKIGGLGMYMAGFGFEKRDDPPSSDDVSAALHPYVDVCIQSFGPGRCMFESNFPVDKSSYGYSIIWNAFKRMTNGYSEAERAMLFAGTAREVYKLSI